jgi:hypothetical protein
MIYPEVEVNFWDSVFVGTSDLPTNAYLVVSVQDLSYVRRVISRILDGLGVVFLMAVA